MTSGQVQLNSSTATAVVAAANVNTVYVGRGTTPRTVVIANVDATNDAYLGGTNAVTSGTGFKLLHGTSVTLTLDADDAVYAIASASTPTLHFISN